MVCKINPLLIALLTSFMASVVNATATEADHVAGEPVSSAIEAGLALRFEEEITAAKKSMMGAPQKALDAAQRAETLAKDDNFGADKKSALATSLWLQAESTTRLNRPVDAAPIIERAMLELDDRKSQLGGDLLLSKGRLSRVLGRDNEALNSFQSAFAIFEEIGSDRSQAIALQGIGTLYDDAHQYRRMIEYYAKASEVFSDDAMLDLVSLNNRANAYRELEEFDKAQALSREALDMAVASGSDMLQARILTNIAVIEIRAGRFDEAATAIEEGLVKIENPEAAGWAPFLWGAKAELELARGDLSAAEQAIEKTFADMDISATTAPFRDFHEIASVIYQKQGSPDLALQHHQAFKKLDDQGRDVAASANLAILNAEFDLANKELEIEKLNRGRLESDIALVKARERQKGTIALGLIIIGLGALLFLVRMNLSARKTHRITAGLNSELAGKNTELAETNIQLEKASQAKMEFLATTSHEIRTPLNAINGLTDVVLNADTISPQDREYLEIVNTSGKHLLCIVNDILDISRLESGRLPVEEKPLNVTDTLLDVAEIWRRPAEQKGLAFTVNSATSDRQYMTDDRLLRQILSNLISNAVKYTNQGEIIVGIETHEEAGFDITVADTGVGVAPELHKQIFESFRQADNSRSRPHEGAGLGLAIVKKIAAALGGDIKMESAPDIGTTFTVSIPAKRSYQVSNEMDAPSVKAAPAEINSFLSVQDEQELLSGLNVLVAEDNANNALLMQAMLKGRVGSVEVAENGEEAVKAVQVRNFDVILMDKRMPVMDGIEAAKAIRSLPLPCHSVPIIAITADILPGSREEILANGMDECIEKPVDADALYSVIAKCVAAGRKALAS